jgi:hypothetical protein
LVKALDGTTTLAETPFTYELWEEIALSLQVEDQPAPPNGSSPAAHLCAWVNGHLLFDLLDENRPLTSGGVALVVDEGHILADHVSVQPIAEVSVHEAVHTD